MNIEFPLKIFCIFLYLSIINILFKYMQISGHIEKKTDQALIILMSLTALYGVLLIYFFPAFHTDDYLVFSYIDAHKGLPVAVDPAADYYLFFRPLSYFFFWVLYHVFGTNALLMKIPALIIFLMLTYGVYKTLSLINNEFELRAPASLTAFATFFFVVHPDMMHCIVWISNANELLMVFFYVLALYVFAKTKMVGAASYIVVVMLSVLSLFAKQQSMHVLLFAGLYLLQGAKDGNTARRAKRIIATGLLIIIAYTVITNAAVRVNSEVITYLWKKPFALIGTVIYILVPVGGERIYQYFIVHKAVAAGATIVAAAIAVWYVLRSSDKKRIFWVVLMALVIFFPRVLAHGGDRVNSVQVFWLSAVLFYVLARFREKKILVILASVLLGVNIITSCLYEYDYIISTARQQKTDREILALTQGREKEYLILVAGDTYLLDYSTHFTASKKFGRSGLQTAPFMVNNMLESSSQKEPVGSVRCEISNRELQLMTLSPHSYLSIDNTNSSYNSFKILETRESAVGRGYSFIRTEMPAGKNERKKIYFDGKEWVRL